MTLKPQDSLAHYRLVEVLGQGGMGVVWRAEDTKLGRHVALKVLPPERVGDEERRVRFLREARTAAAVSHPNIVPVYEIGEAGETIFIAMELVEGETLRARLADGRLSTREVLRFAVEIAEALASAHEAGIVHRDLKPDNVMVRPDGHVKILDFGLAKLRDPDHDTPAATRMETISAEMTREGKIFGTAAYMSPEQARGRKVDFRSDLFSFGVVLYEMVTGISPFRSDNVADTLSSVIRDRPRDAAETNPEMPGELGRILEKCLEKNPAERFQNTGDLAVDLRKLRRATDSHVVSRISDSAPVAAAAATPLWRRPLVLGLALVAVIALVAAMMMQRSPTSGVPGAGAGLEPALAVMPFENLKQADDPERLGQILQELIITDLSDVEALGVFSSQRIYDVHSQITGTSMRFIDPARITAVATKAGATTILTGSLSQLGSHWILTGQLVDVSSGKVLQSERIDGEDLYLMVDELAGKIRADLVDAAAAGTDLAVGERTTESLEAYQAYLEGSELFSRQAYDEADDKLVQALELDPAFGQAQYLLGWVRIWRDKEARELFEALLEGEAFKLPEKERLLARAGLAYDTSNRTGDWGEYERLGRQAVVRYPDEKMAWFVLGDALFHAPGGDRTESMQMFDRALELDPAFEPAYWHIGNIYGSKGLWADLADKVQGLVRRGPENPTWYVKWARALLQQGDAEGAEEVVQEALFRVQDPQDRRRLLKDLAWAFIDVSRRPRAKELLNQALEVEVSGGEDSLHHGLGAIAERDRDLEEAEERYRRALDLNPRNMDTFWGLWNVLRESGRFGELIQLCRSVTTRAPDHLTPYARWMFVTLLMGDEEEAERVFRKALAEVSNDSGRATVWRGRAWASDEIGNRVQALEYHKKAAELTDESEWRLAYYYLDLGRLEEAESAFRAAAKVQERNASPGLFRALRDLGKTEEALLHVERWRKTLPTDNGSHEAIIELHLMAGREADAERALQAGLEFHPLPQDKADLLARAAASYGDAGQPERSEELIRQAMALQGDDAPDWFQEGLIWALMNQQKYDEAEETLEQVMARHEGPPTGMEAGFMMELALARGDADAAVRVTLEHLSMFPLDRGTCWRAAVALTVQGDFARAEPLERKVLAMNPTFDAHQLLAWILIAGDIDVDEGQALAEKARTLPVHWSEAVNMAAAPWYPSVQHALGLAHLKQGRPEEAIPFLEEAARRQPRRTLVQEHLRQARR